jgi:hypothetical protein
MCEQGISGGITIGGVIFREMRKNGGVADRGRASVQCPPTALDAVGHSFHLTVARLRLGNAIALGFDFRPRSKEH